MLSILPAIGALISMLFISVYPLSEEKLKNISQELDHRRGHLNAERPDITANF